MLPSSFCLHLQDPALPRPTSLLPHVPKQCISTSSTFIQPLPSSVSPSSLIVSLACSVARSPQVATVAIPAHRATVPPSSPFSSSLTFHLLFSISSFVSARPSLMIWAAVLIPSSSEINARFSDSSSALLHSQ